MSMIKKGQSFEGAVVGIIDGAAAECENCKAPIDLIESTGGIVECKSCKHKNKIKDMDADNV
jgi:Zn finger protein HypA/HybF involved in hydrogenase expression